MVELLQVHFSFLCRTSRANKKGESPIVFRIVYRDERRDVYTGLYCEKTHWNPETGRIGKLCKKGETINKNLELIHHQALQVFDQLKFSRIPFTIDEFISRLKGKEERPVLLMEYLKARIAQLKKKSGTDITGATYEKYERSGRFVIDFLEKDFQVKNYSLVRIDVQFLEQYFQYLRTVRKIGNNTAVKYMSFFKTLLMPAIQDNTIRVNPFRDIKFRVKTVPKGFLTDEDLNMLIAAKMPNVNLERIRDQYIFCCYTGLAYSDLKQLDRVHFIQHQGGDFYILKPRQKTGQNSIIPLLPAACKILRKYSVSDDFRDFRWHVSVNQKMNERLKTIGEKAGVTKTLHMHLARHTFATTITLSKGVPIETVSSMLGHSSLRQTQHYAKIVALKVVNHMAKVKELYK